MAQVSDLSLTNMTAPAARQTRPTRQTPPDVNLWLQQGTTLNSNTTSSALNVSGGTMALFNHFFTDAGGDNDEVLVVTVQVSLDGGSTYKTLIVMPSFEDDDNDVIVARPIYIPRQDSDQPYAKLRISWARTGTTPNFTDYYAWLSLITDGVLSSAVENLV